ncbi:carbon-nitrogen hydrolase family protein [Clostridium transplantifaecale]|uniref:carbon-nitrogen hydrolase family protein n=1 Tax=Clostridium transplantifaecale TaxID=2479838 RepID=UPI000F63C8B2|nr:carbon-nitrogen hydrolase family protein [Clostridium transplantifaecale]
MEKRFLNVSVMQHTISADLNTNLKVIGDSVESLMMGYVRPELIVGVEFGISKSPISIDDEAIKFLAGLAKKHRVYLVPGTFAEKSEELAEGEAYNTCPVFGPDGTMICRYRKKVPFRPGEMSVPSNEEEDYCIFKIREKGITVGLQICYDQFFPEISRTLALKGAELILCPALDPIEYRHVPEILPRARALENELFYIWTCGTGQLGASTCCGNSVIVDPEGQVLIKCPETPALVTRTLDFSQVELKREYGRDQHLNSLRYFNVQYPFAGRLNEAPVYQGAGSLTADRKEYEEKTRGVRMGNL